MRHLRSIFVLFGVILIAGTASAIQRTFVSAGTGSDASLCTRTAPCRNFAAALAQTDSGGDIVVLDSGGYGAVTIDHQVAITAPVGVYAGITAFTGSAIIIATTGVVRIRGLSLTGLGGSYGVNAGTALSLYVENVVADNFGFDGMTFTGSGYLSVKNSAFRNNSSTGINSSSSATTIITIDNGTFEKNGFAGFESGINTKSVVRDSMSISNQYGYYCSGPGVEMTVENSVGSFGGINSSGVAANNGCVARVSNCTLTNNSNGLQNYANSATVLTRGNNTIEGNASAKTGTVGPYSPQ